MMDTTPTLDVHALARIVRTLADLAAMESVNERGRSYGPQTSRATEPDALTPTEAASANGTLARGLTAHAVVRRLPAEAQDLASWIAHRARGLVDGPLDVRSLARHLGAARGPEDDRTAYAAAVAAEVARAADHKGATDARERLATITVTTRRLTRDERNSAFQRLATARTDAEGTAQALANASARREGAEAILVAWGEARLAGLVTAWTAVTEAQDAEHEADEARAA